MLRGLIGYILGMLSCFNMVGSYISCSDSGDFSDFFISIGVSVVILVLLLFWCHKHHVKKRGEYYDKIRNRSHNWW